MTPQQIQKKVLARIEALGTTVSQIKVGRFKNPFPVGLKSVYLASRGIASERCNEHLRNYFVRLEHQSEEDKIAQMVRLLHAAMYGVHTDAALTKFAKDFLEKEQH